MSAARTRVGVGVIVCRAGRVLLGRRLGSHGSGSWALPGGHLDFGESAETCATRELLEETGLTASGLRRAPFTVDNFLVDGAHYVTLFVEAVDVVGDPETREPEKCAGWEWFRWDDLPEPLFQPLRSLRELGFVPAGVSLRGE